MFSALWGRCADWKSHTSCEWRMVFIFTTSRVFESLSSMCNKKEYRKLFVILFTCMFCLLFTVYGNCINLSGLWKYVFVNYFLFMYKANVQTHQNKKVRRTGLCCGEKLSSSGQAQDLSLLHMWITVAFTSASKVQRYNFYLSSN